MDSYYRRFPLPSRTFIAESCCLIPLKSRSGRQQTRWEILVIKSAAVFADLIFSGLGWKRQVRSEHEEMKIQSKPVNEETLGPQCILWSTWSLKGCLWWGYGRPVAMWSRAIPSPRIISPFLLTQSCLSHLTSSSLWLNSSILLYFFLDK